jgi:hypothetical protein
MEKATKNGGKMTLKKLQEILGRLQKQKYNLKRK